MSRIVRALAATEGLDREAIGHAVTAATLHDAGRLVLASSLADDYGVIIDRAIAERRPLVDVEQDALGSTHAEVGAYLLGLWGLPDQVTTAVAWHHRPGASGVAGVSPLALVHAADAIAGERCPAGVPILAPAVDLDFLASIGARRDYDAWKMESQRILEAS
jgi:HD-like signal output (HDOD) protein